MEVQDIIKFKLRNPLVTLNDSVFSLSSQIKEELECEFLSGKPFVHLLEEAEFFGHKFYVNKDVLIPRPETELLVDIIRDQSRKFEKVLDVGTGSGVILLTLLLNETVSYGVGADISPQALEVAGVNKRRFKLEQKCELVLSDRLSKIQGKFDLIVSNPPYIKQTAHFDLVHQSVSKYEPSLALFLPDSDYDAWFLSFFQAIKSHLNPGGLFMMEGHENELQNQIKMLNNLGFHNTRVLQDLSGRDRFLSAAL